MLGLFGLSYHRRVYARAHTCNGVAGEKSEKSGEVRWPPPTISPTPSPPASLPLYSPPMPRKFADDVVPSWVHLAVERWGRAKRRIWMGGYVVKSGGPAVFHCDGFPARSVLAKIRDERDGAGTNRTMQRWSEVMTGDELEVQRATLGMPEKPFAALHLQYVFDRDMLTKPEKAAALRCSTTEFYAATCRGLVWVHAKLEAGSSDFDLTRILGALLREGLQTAKLSSTTHENLGNYPLRTTA